jgi:hypothetical protein
MMGHLEVKQVNSLENSFILFCFIVDQDLDDMGNDMIIV